MKSSLKPRAGQGGFTLVELMISLVIFSFAIAGVLAAGVSMSQGLHEQRAAVTAETATRVPLDFLQDALREASPGSPTLNIMDTLNASTCTIPPGPAGVPLAVSFSNNTGINGSDILDVIYASGAVVTSLRTPYGPTSTSSITVNDASQLAVGDQLVISNLSQGVLVRITGISGTNLNLAPQACTPGIAFPNGSIVIRAQHARFLIGTVDSNPTLMMNPTGDSAQDISAAEPMAEGIEDLQVAFGWDQGTGTVVPDSPIAGADGWYGNVAAEPVIFETAPGVSPATVLRAARITLIARTLSSYIGASAPFRRPAAEDHAISATFDQYRRRVLQTSTEIRNSQGSP